MLSDGLIWLWFSYLWLFIIDFFCAFFDSLLHLQDLSALPVLCSCFSSCQMSTQAVKKPIRTWQSFKLFIVNLSLKTSLLRLRGREWKLTRHWLLKESWNANCKLPLVMYRETQCNTNLFSFLTLMTLPQLLVLSPHSCIISDPNAVLPHCCYQCFSLWREKRIENWERINLEWFSW